MKKLLSIILIFAMSISLGGCGAKKPESTIVKLTPENFEEFFILSLEDDEESSYGKYITVSRKIDFTITSPIVISFEHVKHGYDVCTWCDPEDLKSLKLSAENQNKFHITCGFFNYSRHDEISNIKIESVTGTIELPAGSAIETTSQS